MGFISEGREEPRVPEVWTQKQGRGGGMVGSVHSHLSQPWFGAWMNRREVALRLACGRDGGHPLVHGVLTSQRAQRSLALGESCTADGGRASGERRASAAAGTTELPIQGLQPGGGRSLPQQARRRWRRRGRWPCRLLHAARCWQLLCSHHPQFLRAKREGEKNIPTCIPSARIPLAST